MTSRVIAGLNSAGFITSSALLVDGQLVYAVEEERLIREKRSRKFPGQGIKKALEFAKLDFKDIDAFAVAWNPAINLEVLNIAQTERPRFLGEIFYNVPNALMNLSGKQAGAVSQQIIELDGGGQLKIAYVTHHLAHASSFFFSPFDHAAVLTVDAFGEKHCSMICEGRGNDLKVRWSQEFPHSLGAFYSTFTEFAGFSAQSDEWKVMGAGPYGDSSKLYDKVRSLVRLQDDGGFELDLSYFNHYQFHRPGRFTPKMQTLLGFAPNKKSEAEIGQQYYDLCAAVQRVMEDIYFHMLKRAHALTGSDNIVLSGGCALNSVANGKITANTPFKNVWVPSVPDDSGGCLGAAFYLRHQVEKQPRSYVLTANYLGPGFENSEIEDQLRKYGLKYRKVENPAKTAADLIANGNIIGWFQGRLEFGDRALGNRSILADPRDEKMKDKVNAMVKYREPFRPFAPSILAEHLDEYFVGAAPTPFMEKVFPIRPEKRKLIPAVTHVDGSGRLQTVTTAQNPLYHQLISAFHAQTGIPIVLNTSFNLKGEAVVCAPADALRTFFSSGLNALVIGNCVLEKSAQ